MSQINKMYRIRISVAVRELKRLEMVRGLTKSERAILKQFECLILG